MNRHDDWQARLSDVIRARREQDFQWGTRDCTQFVFDAIVAVIDRDMGARYRGKYSTAKGALRILQKVDGVKTPRELMETWFGEPLPIAFARKGDVVLCDPETVGCELQDGTDIFGPAIGVCYGHLTYFVSNDGLTAVDTLQCDACFHILLREPE